MILIRLIYLLNVIIVLKCSDTQYSNVTLLAEENGDFINFTCLLEGQSLKLGATWDAPFENYANITESRYLPNSKMLCDYADQINSTPECVPGNTWSINQAVDFKLKPLTDYRWENFQIITSSKGQRKQLFKFSKNTFNIALSFRTKNDVQLYLSSNSIEDQGLNSEDFVISINKTAVSLYGNQGNQRMYLNSTSINKLEDDRWINFIITHTGILLILRIAENRTTWKTEGRTFTEKYLTVQSEGHSLWKVHNCNDSFLSTNKRTNPTQIGRKEFEKSTPYCVSLYVALCPTCVMNLTLEADNSITGQEYSTTLKVENPLISEKTGGTIAWKEVKVISNITDTNHKIGYSLFLETSNTNGSEEGFWGVDNLRLCHPNEVRVLNLTIKENKANRIKCRTLLDDPVGISKPISITGCSDNSTIGTYCNISCEHIFGVEGKSCDRNIKCRRKNNIDECYCSPGYQGRYCQEECDQGKWGIGCKDECVNCYKNICSPIKGSCTQGCSDGFVGPNCTFPAPVKNLRATNTTLNSITIEWDSPSSNTTRKFSYIATYKHKKYVACGNDSAKHDITPVPIINGSRKMIVTSLLPYSEYYFTVVAKDVNGISGESTNYTTSTNYTDTPDNTELPANITSIKNTTNQFPTILLTEPPCSHVKGPLIYDLNFTCTNDWCKEFMVSINYTNTFDTKRTFQKTVEKLVPYSNYRVSIAPHRPHGTTQSSFQREFTTNPAKPLGVNNLTVYCRNESTLWLRWKAAYPPHGKLQHYKIHTKNDKIEFVLQSTPCELWDDYICTNIQNLTKHTRYTVTVQAKNVDVAEYGKEESITAITQEDVSGPPMNVKSTWNKDVVTLQWDHPLITNGPLVNFSIYINVIQSEYSKHTSFCKNFPLEKYMKTYKDKIYLNYSTEYNVTVVPFNVHKGNPSKSINITMPPPTPSLQYYPTIVCIDSKCDLKIRNSVNVSESSYLFVIISSKELIEKNTTQLLINSAKNDQNKTEWLAIALPVSNLPTVQLGDGTNTSSMYGLAINKPLQNDSHYIVTVIIANYFSTKTRFSERYSVYSDFEDRMFKFTAEANTINVAFYALFLLLLIPVGICGWIVYVRRNKSKTENKMFINKWLLPTCLKERTTVSEHLPLHTSERHGPTSESSKLDFDKQRSIDAVHPESPLISHDYGENTQLTRRVKLEDFEEYLKESIGTTEEDGELVRQHNLFVRGQTKPWEYGLRKENKFKNRYNNLIAYDHSRVKLEKRNNDDFSDYINANYINGYKQPNAYIATQGPKPITVFDFWSMIWQERATTIVMVANIKEDGKKKCEEYWPKLNYSLTFGSIEVYHQRSEIFSNYVFRTLQVIKDNEKRTIEQLHFTSWPDHGVPLYPQTLISFVDRVRRVPQNVAPIVVHCSAGVGRTGTIILCDYILRMAEGEGVVDFLATLQELRQQRANLVDSPAQYKLAHFVVFETLFGLDTTIECNYKLEEKIETLINSTDLYEQMKYLEKVIWQDQVMYSSYKSIPNSANKNKNRFSDIVPDGYARVYITRYPVSDEHSDYINAVEVDGYCVPKRFIVTQQPLPVTVIDFWRMVSEKDVITIVSLNDIEPQDQSSCIFWPEEDEILDVTFGTVKYVEKNEHVEYDIIRLSLMNISEEEREATGHGRSINIIKMKGWPSLQPVPENLDALMEIWRAVDKLSRGNNPIVVTCYDGAKACGVFVALSFVIEKIKFEQVCDVCLAVRTIRRSRKEFVINTEQFKLLYKAAVQYLKSFETYSNFPVANK